MIEKIQPDTPPILLPAEELDDGQTVDIEKVKRHLDILGDRSLVERIEYLLSLLRPRDTHQE